MTQKRTILIAEDDMFVADVYMVKFTGLGHEVLLASNGKEALKILEEKIPDIILLDVMMPYMDGTETLRAIKKDDRLKKIPVLILSNISDREHITGAMDLGADGYCIKAHFTPSEVAKKALDLLDRK